MVLYEKQRLWGQTEYQFHCLLVTVPLSVIPDDLGKLPTSQVFSVHVCITNTLNTHLTWISWALNEIERSKYALDAEEALNYFCLDSSAFVLFIITTCYKVADPDRDWFPRDLMAPPSCPCCVLSAICSLHSAIVVSWMKQDISTGRQESLALPSQPVGPLT